MAVVRKSRQFLFIYPQNEFRISSNASLPAYQVPIMADDHPDVYNSLLHYPEFPYAESY